jgi:hypothetical protein
VYSSFAVQRHVIWSSIVSSLSIELITSQSSRYSWTSTMELRGKMCAIQVLLVSALETEIFFRLAFLNKIGAIVFGVVPSIHEECQNCALFPFPTLTIVDALNKALSVLSVGMSTPHHGRPSSFHLNQYQQTLRALAYALDQECLVRPRSSVCKLLAS